MKMTIYLPDDLADQVKAVEDLNVSAVCQEALRSDLARRATLGELDNGMSRHVLDVADPESSASYRAAFTGRQIAEDMSHRGSGGTVVYFTAKHRIAIYTYDDQRLDHYDNLDDAEQTGWYNTVMLAQAGEELGEERVVELDI